MTASTATAMEGRTVSKDRAASAVKTILFNVQNDRSQDKRMETALSLARACKAHLSCLHITSIEAYAAFDSFGGIFVMDDVAKAVGDEELRLRSRLEKKLRSEDAPWDYLQVTGNVPTQIIRHAALTDLIVVGREAHRHEFAAPTIGLLGDLLYRSRTPLFIPSENGGPVDPTGTVIIAWDTSHEAANAVRAAIGLLKLATDIRIVQVRETDKTEALPGKRLLEYLSRHGIHADLQIESPSGAKGEAVAGVLLAHAKSASASYIVMGGYNHSRIGEYFFGGVTRALLGDCPLPLFIAH